MDKTERLKRSMLFTRIKEVRNDAFKQKQYAEQTGDREFSFWDGYLEGVDYIIYLLQDMKSPKHKTKKSKTSKAKKTKTSKTDKG
jgi:hypothetical protein